MINKKIILLSVLAIVIFSLGIFTTNMLQPANAQEAAISLERAQEIALNASGGGVVTEAKMDNKFGMLKYKIEVINGNIKHEFDINAATGTIIKHEQEMKRKQRNSIVSISAEQAKITALDRTGGGIMVKCKLDYKKTGLEYDITIVKGDYKYELDIDARTGSITQSEREIITRSKIASTANMITHAQAKEIAINQTGGGNILKSELDYEDKRRVAIYEVEIVRDNVKYEYDINAISGVIITYETDYYYNVNR